MADKKPLGPRGRIKLKPHEKSEAKEAKKETVSETKRINKERVAELIDKMTVEEKAMLLSGFDYWNTTAVERLGIPSLSFADGPHGLRKQQENELSLEKSFPSTCFPTSALTACSWDEELVYRLGEAVAKEARSFGISCVLGPGVNIKRSPLCGRNFEYYSEDPLLSGRLGAAFVNGIQSQGISACIKHFAANNQEDYRLTVDVKVDERALREIYLASFEYALMYSNPKAMMCSYNKINGIYASENRRLLTDILRDEWDYDGIVMADWGASNCRPQGVWAGLDLEMPGSFGVNTNEIIKSVNGEKPFIDITDSRFTNLSEDDLNISVERMLEFVLELEDTTGFSEDIVPFAEHHELAREIASESIVLLTNENDTLPLQKGINVAIVGDLAANPVFQGGGSSRIMPTKIEFPLECIRKYANASYVDGENISKSDAIIIGDADAVIIFAGMPDNFDTEGSDRTGMRLPEVQYSIIDAISQLNPNTVTVLCAGAPVELPQCPAVLMAYLGGQAMGGAVADILFGEVNPCGKLAETFPLRIEDTPSFVNFPGDGEFVNYGEGIYVGYRWYDRVQIPTQHDLGHGLSYTTFEYSDLAATQNWASVKVTNVGDRDGKEVVQFYINGELKGFKKVFIKSGETVSVLVDFMPRAFSFWNVETEDWRIKGGEYMIYVGGLYKMIEVKSTLPIPKITMYTLVKDLLDIPGAKELFNEIEAALEIDGIPLLEKRDCSTFVVNILRNLVTLFNIGWTFEELQAKIDKINELNGV